MEKGQYIIALMFWFRVTLFFMSEKIAFGLHAELKVTPYDSKIDRFPSRGSSFLKEVNTMVTTHV
jgi:hypothetical protein